MRFPQQIFARSPAVARVAPFLVFLALTFFQGKFGAASAYWFYFAKTLAGAWLVWEMRPFVAEMRWAFSWEAVLSASVFLRFGSGWIAFYPHLMKGGRDGKSQRHVWRRLHARLVFHHGSYFWNDIVVPPLEEVFYRSFLYRYLASQNFLAVPLNQFLPFPFFATAIVFGFSHNEWLAGILCGAAYQWLVLRKNRLGDAMTAHAITNFLLGAWIVWKHAWNFW